MVKQKVASNEGSKQGLFFLLIGGLAALVHFLSLIFFVQVLEIEPNFANIYAFLIAFCCGFIGHLNFTFKTNEQTKNWKSKLGKWFLSSILGFVLNQIIFVYGTYLLGESYYVLIWIVATGIVTIMTFLLAKFWAFKGTQA
jgi:putative flippase GtrA